MLEKSNMSAQGSIRQRGGNKRSTTPNPDSASNGFTTAEKLDQVKGAEKDVVQRDWDYKLALSVITMLAFITRFWGISHPNQVVFDEVHFGKVCIFVDELRIGASRT